MRLDVVLQQPKNTNPKAVQLVPPASTVTSVEFNLPSDGTQEIGWGDPECPLELTCKPARVREPKPQGNPRHCSTGLGVQEGRTCGSKARRMNGLKGRCLSKALKGILQAANAAAGREGNIMERNRLLQVCSDESLRSPYRPRQDHCRGAIQQFRMTVRHGLKQSIKEEVSKRLSSDVERERASILAELVYQHANEAPETFHSRDVPGEDRRELDIVIRGCVEKRG